MCLPPFFNRNPVVLKYFEDAVGKGCDNLQPVVEVLKKIEARQTSCVGTPYECPKGSPAINGRKMTGPGEWFMGSRSSSPLLELHTPP